MKGSTPSQGICGTCRHAAECTYPRNPRHPVYYCCEHEAFGESESDSPLSPLSSGVFAARATRMEVPPQAAPQEPSGCLGLCSNCERRATCTFPKPAGGVWRCEEYL